jgi:hypothetical protein
VPENAENGDFGHTAPLTGPQIKGNFNKIGWQGERIACQCQFFSSLLGKENFGYTSPAIAARLKLRITADGSRRRILETRSSADRRGRREERGVAVRFVRLPDLSSEPDVR